MLWLKSLYKDKKLLLYWVTQKNSIEFQIQASLPYMMSFVLRPSIILICITWLCDSDSNMYDNPMTDVIPPSHMISCHTFV